MWHCLHGTPSFRVRLVGKHEAAALHDLRGRPVAPRAAAQGLPALIPLKWHRKQTPVSTWVCDPLTMCSPWTIA